MDRVVDRVDRFQREHPVIGLPLAVVYKYFDDQGPFLAAALTYYTFVAIFPILLIATSVLGFVLQGRPELTDQLLDSALRQFPIVGTQLGRPEGIKGSAGAVVVGSIAALYGATGLGGAAHNALNIAWAVPRNSRFNPFVSRFRSLVSLTLAGVIVILLSALSVVTGNLDALGLDLTPLLRWGGTAVSLLVTALVLALMMRYITAERPSFRSSLPGAGVIAVLWHLLQLSGGEYVRRIIASASAMNSVFALVLGLIGLIYLAATAALLGLEVNVVLRRRLYPRALLTPFTDAVALTEADRRAYEAYAKMQRHKGFERVEVTFEERGPAAPRGIAVGGPDRRPGSAPAEPTRSQETRPSDAR